jgi:hypothetical protein
MSHAFALASLSSRRVSLLFAPMSAEEVLASLAGLPAARPTTAAAPLLGAVLIADIEVAASPQADERSLRKRWRERRGGGATPLLLIADDPSRPVRWSQSGRSMATASSVALARPPGCDGESRLSAAPRGTARPDLELRISARRSRRRSR